MADPKKELVAAWRRAAREDLGSAVKLVEGDETYPEEVEPPDVGQARQGIETAKYVLDFVAALLPGDRDH